MATLLASETQRQTHLYERGPEWPPLCAPPSPRPKVHDALTHLGRAGAWGMCTLSGDGSEGKTWPFRAPPTRPLVFITVAIN
eukprot:13341061-Alexandrium_andersonii.AAC.1